MKPLTALAAALLVTLPLTARADDDADRTADLSRRFTYANVTSTDASEIFSSMKISSSFNPKHPKHPMTNPDPAWIPGWASLELTNETQTAILQAAINRTWTEQATRAYAHYRAEWAKLDTQFRPQLERAKTGTYYARAAALAQLLADVRKAADAAKVLYPDGSAPATVGFIDEIVVAMVALHRDTRHEFMLDAYLQKQNVRLADFQATGRPFAPDATERELFVAFSETRGTLDNTPPLPHMAEYGHAYAAVKWPTVKHAAAAQQAIASALEANASALAPSVKLGRMSSLFGGDQGDPADPKLRWIDAPAGGGVESWSPLVVTKVGSTIELTTKFDRMVPARCKNTNQLDTTGSGRTWVQDCTYKHDITTHTLVVTFPELPDGLELKKGDVVALWGDVEATKETKTSVRDTITARGLASVKRGNTAVWP